MVMRPLRGHFSSKCRAPRSQDTKHKESTRKNVPVEKPASAALVSTDLNCSSSCLENVKILNEQNEQLLKDLRTSKIHAITYKTGLKSVEARLLVYKKNESVYEEDIKVLKREIHLRQVSITELMTKLELAQKQKDEIQLTIENFENSSNCLSKLLDCQIVDKCKTKEFVNEPIVSEPTVKKPMVKTSEAKASVDKPKVVRKNFCSPLIEDWISDSEDEAESKSKIEKKTVKPSFAKIKFVKSKEQVKSPSLQLLNKGNPQMDLQDKGVIDSGCSRNMTGNMFYLTNYEEINGGYVAFGGNPKRGKITGKDDYSRFTWVFFLASKDETSAILKTFIIRIENLVDHKADEGFFVGYSLNSKAFRVFNSRTMIVEENLHIRFSENTPNVVGSEPDWLFDIDALTRTMNYEPITAGTQSNGFAATKACDNADQEKNDNVNNTNNVNAAGTNRFNIVGAYKNYKLPFYPEMPALEDISTFNLSSDHEDDKEEADMNNMDTTIQVSPVPTTRIHKDHPFDQVIGDMHLTTQKEHV
nr:ribonuclease H-like domain-containing protein [Tanacetum cinerariifolium]